MAIYSEFSPSKRVIFNSYVSFPSKIVIFHSIHSYVSLPEGIPLQDFPKTCPEFRSLVASRASSQWQPCSLRCRRTGWPWCLGSLITRTGVRAVRGGVKWWMSGMEAQLSYQTLGVFSIGMLSYLHLYKSMVTIYCWFWVCLSDINLIWLTKHDWSYAAIEPMPMNPADEFAKASLVSFRGYQWDHPS